MFLRGGLFNLKQGACLVSHFPSMVRICSFPGHGSSGVGLWPPECGRNSLANAWDWDLSIPHHPEARKTSRAQRFNRRLLARLSFKFLWAACPVSGTHRFGVLVTPCRFFEALQKADTCKLHRLSWSMGYLEPAVWHSLFVILGQPSWKKLLQTKLRVLLATCCSLLSLPFKSGCAEGAYHQGTQFCQMLTGNNYWSQQEADQLYPKILFPTKEENPDKMYLVVNIPAANSLYKIVSISHVL